jgi:hypothetical protein
VKKRSGPVSVSRKGLVPHEVNPSSIPGSLRIIQRGSDLSHFEITPRPGATLTPAEFIAAYCSVQRNRMSILVTHGIEFPEGFDDYAWEAEAKGRLQGTIVIINQQRYRVTFYDPTRLSQDIEGELTGSAAFLEHNLVVIPVIPSVTRTHVEKAIDFIAETGRHGDLIREQAE